MSFDAPPPPRPTTSSTSARVRRRWLPHRDGKGVRARIGGKEGFKRRAEYFDVLDGGLDFGIDAIGVIVLLVVAIVVLVLLGGPIVLIGIDLIWMLGALLISTFARFVLGHPWRVDAVVGDQHAAWDVQGFRAAGRLRDDVRSQLELGVPLSSISPPAPPRPTK